MKKILSILGFFLVIALAGTSYSWQGRMEGMGNPSGLIEDESDFLTHPAKIASSGEGVKYYVDYKFNYTDIMHWKYKLDETDLLYGGTFPYRFNSSSAHQYDHNSLMGATFPLTKGRMGVFFSYDKKMGDFDGHGSYEFNDDAGLPVTKRSNYDLDSNLNNYALRLIYGLPVGSADLGFELGFAHRDEDQNGTVIVPAQLGPADVTIGSKNYIFGLSDPRVCLSPFMIPYDSSYWELFGKAGVKKKLTSDEIDWSVRGSYILSADSKNKYGYWFDNSSEDTNQAKMRGDVRGYEIGSDLWIRHQVHEGLTLPFLVSVSYDKKNRDGGSHGIGNDDIEDNHFYEYEHTTKIFNVKAGGGLEKKVSTCGLISAGLYYNYLQSRDDLSFFVSGSEPDSEETEHFPNDQSEFPLHKEHRLVLNLAGEQEVSSGFTVRGGLDFFYGWIPTYDYKQNRISYENDDTIFNSTKTKISLDGKNWGINASLGATKKFSTFALEPFLKAGYRWFDVSGSGKSTFIIPPPENYLYRMDKERSEWCLGAGVSLLFGK